jgi:ferredoxin-NADP reductase
MHLNHHYVVLAAGRGIEPIMPTLEALLSRDSKSRVQLFYGNRNREAAAHA